MHRRKARLRPHTLVSHPHSSLAMPAKKPSPKESDDALLDAAIAEAAEAKAQQDAAAAAAAAEAASHVRPLSLKEVVAKLNTVPVFKVTNNETGDIVPTPEKNGAACVCWYLDKQDAQVALAIVEAKEPALAGRVALGMAPLGIALAMSEEWGTMASGHEMTQPMRLQASNAVLRGAKGEVEPLPERLRTTLNARTSSIPVFIMEALQSPSCSPVFFRRSDLVACWEATGRPAAAMPNTMTMFDLRVLVVRMLSQKADWRSLTFVGAEGSIAAAEEENQDPRLQAAAAGAAAAQKKRAVDAGDEPPPLEADPAA